MTKNYFFELKRITTIVLISLFCLSGIKSAGQLTQGDFAIVGFNGNSPTVNLAIAAFTTIPSGTVVKITDKGWDQASSTLAVNGSDGLITWTTTSTIPAGTLFNIAITGGATPTATGLASYGTVTASGWGTGTVVAGGGDNWFIYIGSDASPNFIYGFANWSTSIPGSNSPDPVTGWQAAGTVSAAVSYLPPMLSIGNFYVTLTKAGTPPAGYHGDYNNYAGTFTGSQSTLLTSINDKSNWVTTEIIGNKKSLDPGGAAFPGSNPIFNMSTLPLTLQSFTGKELRESVYLVWTTADEINTAAFDIERSVDGSTYVNIGSTPANTINSYNYSDNTVTPGAAYAYRLKMRDIDGRFTYSPVINVRYGGKPAAGYSIYPNPVAGSQLYLKTPTGNNAGVLATILDPAGRSLYKISFNTSITGNGYYKIPVKQLPAGTYLIQISGNDGVTVQVIRFVVGG